MAGITSTLLEALAFDGVREPVGIFDMVTAGFSPQVNGRRLALIVASVGTGIGNTIQTLYQPVTGADTQRTPSIFKSGASALVANTDTALWTPAGGRKFRLLWMVASHSVASDLIMKDNNAGTQIAEYAMTAAGAPAILVPPFANGYLSAAANNTLSARVVNAGTLTWVAWGTEE